MADTMKDAFANMIPNMGMWTDMARQWTQDSMKNYQSMSEEMGAMRERSAAHMAVAMEDYQQLVKTTMDYQLNLFQEMQRTSQQMMQQSMSFMAPKGDAEGHAP
ncbi:MAG: hypothetical protein AAGI01_18100 [Myxococcota bacterium]